MESFKDVQHLWNMESWSEHGDITKGTVTTKSVQMRDILWYSTSFWHSLVLDSPTVIYIIPNVLWSWLHRSLAVHTASTQHKPLHQQPMAVHLLLPVNVVMEMSCLLQGSYQYAAYSSWQRDPSEPPTCVYACVYVCVWMCTWVCQERGNN